jgi:magnesium transporter
MQALTVALRALANRELTGLNALRIIGKETFVVGINGIICAIVIGVVATL